MYTGTISCGFTFSISERVLNDWRIMELLEQLDSNPLATVRLAKLILREDNQYQKLIDTLSEEDGYVDTEKMSNAIIEIFQYSQETKN